MIAHSTIVIPREARLLRSDHLYGARNLLFCDSALGVIPSPVAVLANGGEGSAFRFLPTRHFLILWLFIKGQSRQRCIRSSTVRRYGPKEV
jgi:hypothetical protein